MTLIPDTTKSRNLHFVKNCCLMKRIKNYIFCSQSVPLSKYHLIPSFPEFSNHNLLEMISQKDYFIRPLTIVFQIAKKTGLEGGATHRKPIILKIPYHTLEDLWQWIVICIGVLICPQNGQLIFDKGKIPCWTRIDFVEILSRSNNQQENLILREDSACQHNLIESVVL